MSLNRHDPKRYTQTDLEDLISSLKAWIQRGSALYEAALATKDILPEADGTFVEYFGTVNGRVIGGEDHVRSRNQAVAGMLFGMACECWCKALWLGSVQGVDRKILSVSKDFKSHDIEKLLERSGVEPLLSKADLEYAELLTSLIMGAGRFAGPLKVKQLIPWADQAVDQVRWTAICEAIGKRRDDLGLY